jgi:hypothetical protein
MPRITIQITYGHHPNDEAYRVRGFPQGVVYRSQHDSDRVHLTTGFDPLTVDFVHFLIHDVHFTLHRTYFFVHYRWVHGFTISFVGRTRFQTAKPRQMENEKKKYLRTILIEQSRYLELKNGENSNVTNVVSIRHG